jgi:nicotinate-nucleotide pyrophosphorylase (carboxylating)
MGKLPAQAVIMAMVRLALAEDVGAGDITADLLDDSVQAQAKIITREHGILCGSAWLEEVYRQLGFEGVIDWQVADGDPVNAGQSVCRLQGRAKPLLTGERCALNFLQTLSATATKTHAYQALLAGTHTQLLDTRKTLPGWRQAQKYAVACGGGMNHRFGLYDAILIKENHIRACGSIANAVARAKMLYPEVLLEVEVENLLQLAQAIEAGATRVMLDNFSLPLMQQAVDLANGQVELEVSGGVQAENLVAIAHTGVNYISVGALTKDIQALDLSMQFIT